MTKQNIFENIKRNQDKEHFKTLVNQNNVRIETIVSTGQTSAKDFWYDQEEHEFVMIVQGEAKLEFENKIVSLNVGDCLSIAAHEKHRVEYTSLSEPTIWLAVFYTKE